jgi:RNA polymerase sigma-70 factor (ECF subfamily)
MRLRLTFPVSDPAEFRAVYLHFLPRIRVYLERRGANADEARELSQEVLLTVWNKQELFDPGRASLSAWIYAIARNKFIDRVRRMRRAEVDPLDPCLVSDDEAPSPESSANRSGRAAPVKQALTELTKEQQVLVLALYYEGLSMSEFAEREGIALGTVKSRARKVLQLLRQKVELSR